MKVEIYAYTSNAGSKVSRIVEIDDEEWAASNARERGEIVLELLVADYDMLDFGWNEQT